jgi:hypothetical protein
MRVLVAFDEVYRTYREVIATGIQLLRPQVEVTTTALDELEQEVARLDPQVVVCSRDRPASVPPGVAWIMVPFDPVPRTSEVTLEKLLEIIDRVQETGQPGQRRAKHWN